MRLNIHWRHPDGCGFTYRASSRFLDSFCLSQAFNKNKHVLKINPKEKKRWCESPETTFALALNRPRKPVHHLNPSDSDPHFIKSPRDTDRKSLQEHRKLVELQEHVLAWWQSQKWSFGLLKFTLCGFLFSLLKRNEV